MSGNIGVVGAGLMGSEIALIYALAGHDVLLSDRSEVELTTALGRLASILDKGIARGFYEEAQKSATLGRIAVTADLARFAAVRLVTERLSEDEQVQPGIFRQP